MFVDVASSLQPCMPMRREIRHESRVAGRWNEMTLPRTVFPRLDRWGPTSMEEGWKDGRMVEAARTIALGLARGANRSAIWGLELWRSSRLCKLSISVPIETLCLMGSCRSIRDSRRWFSYRCRRRRPRLSPELSFQVRHGAMLGARSVETASHVPACRELTQTALQQATHCMYRPDGTGPSGPHCSTRLREPRRVVNSH